MKIHSATALILMLAAAGSLSAAELPDNLNPEKLVPWCIVPFDAKQRTPEHRAEMLVTLGLRRCAYDWRPKHVAQFEEEILQYKKRGIEMFAFWEGHDQAFALFKKHDLHPQIWRILGSPNGDTQEQKVAAAAQSLEAIARRTAELGCKLSLYNHGGWGGEPENLVAVCRQLRDRGHVHVGIVYNWHHGHGHIEDWPQVLALMKPYLHCLNINGMNAGAQPKILPLAQGQHELNMLKAVVASGYDGPIGILDHQEQLDSQQALQDNLDGLQWLKKEMLQPGSGGNRPIPKAKPLSETASTPQTNAPPQTPAVSFGREPLDPTSNPYWQAPVNRDRLYDFYAKQAAFYGTMTPAASPTLLPAYPGLDGGKLGHWGNQNDQETWKDSRVRDIVHGSMVSGVFRGAGKTIARAVSVQLNEQVNVVFNQDTLQFELGWHGPLARWSDVRYGLMHGIPIGSDDTIPVRHAEPPTKGARYLGLYRENDRVIFVSLENGDQKYRTAVVVDGKIQERIVLKPQSAPPQWPDRIITQGQLGDDRPYAIDTFTLPYENPWKSLFFVGDLDCLSKNRLVLCNMHGDVWICDVVKEDLSELRWKRFAAGLHQPLGLKVVEGVIHVMCRDQIVALHDLNHDDEADFYQCVFNAHDTSAGGHDFITGLQRDAQGRWYFASGNQGVCRVSSDGTTLEVLGNGLRNPNGLDISPDGSVVLTTVQEGNWTPASAICDMSQGQYFGAKGPVDQGHAYTPPMLYLPRGADNSSGGEVYIQSDRWGPVKDRWIHFSMGFATHFLILREVIDGKSQGAAIPMHGEFLSGGHRGRFSPYDGQLYVAGSQGWGNYGLKDGSLQRVRHTGGTYPYPISFETRSNGLLLTFAEPQSETTAQAERWFAQQWNYQYGPGYGSDEFSTIDPNRPGHDRLVIRSVQRLGDGTQLFIEIPQLQPVHQLHLYSDGASRIEVFATLHHLGKPFTEFPGYQNIAKITDRKMDAPSTPTSTSMLHVCSACHHPTLRVVGPPLAEIRQPLCQQSRWHRDLGYESAEQKPQPAPHAVFSISRQRQSQNHRRSDSVAIEKLMDTGPTLFICSLGEPIKPSSHAPHRLRHRSVENPDRHNDKSIVHDQCPSNAKWWRADRECVLCHARRNSRIRRSHRMKIPA